MQHSFDVDRDDLLMTLHELLRIDSVLPKEEELVRYLADRVRELGLEPKLEEVAPGRPNLYVTLDSGKPGPFLVFSGHADTVPPAADWPTDPFTPREVGGRLYGLGAINMKAGLACMWAALRTLARREYRETITGRLGFAVTVDQEGHSEGARALLRTDYGRCDGMLHAEHFHGDSADDYLPSGGAGKVLYSIEVRGRAGHALRPEGGGLNAITLAARMVSAVEQTELPLIPEYGRGSMCVLNIEGGPRQYAMVVPEQCRFLVNRLLVPGEEESRVREDLANLLAPLAGEGEFEISSPPPAYPPYSLETSAAVTHCFRAAYDQVIGRQPIFAFHRGIVDANLFAGEAGIPTVVFGPKGKNHHRPGEYVELDSLMPTAAVYVATALRYLGTA